MASVLDRIKYIAPKIDADNDISIKIEAINIATNQINRQNFLDQDNYNLAVAYYSCHLLELRSRDAEVRGVMTSEREGAVGRTYQGNMGTATTNSTQYLDSYNKLLDKIIVPFVI